MSEYITNTVLRHGMGSKVLKILFLMGYSNYLGKKFVYTPLSYEGDGINFGINELKSYSPKKITNEREEYLEFCNRWDKTLGFKGLTINDIDRNTIQKLTHPLGGITEDLMLYYKGENKQKIKDNFSIPKPIKKDFIEVNVHVRRGDVTTAEWVRDRWLDDEYYLKIIQEIESVLGDNCKINIHTQKGFNENKFTKYNIVYDTEKPDDQVWVQLVNSDVLVMGLSSYSYSASMLCDGICVYPPQQLNVCGPKICDNWVLPNELKEKLKEKYEKSINNRD